MKTILTLVDSLNRHFLPIYGNDWVQVLERHFTEAVGQSGQLVLEYDQRYAMEKDYDYGYVDVSDDGGHLWETLATFMNTGFMETPGYSQDWDSESYGHPVLDLSAYAGSAEAERATPLASRAAVWISPIMSRSLLLAAPSVPSARLTPASSSRVTGQKPLASFRLDSGQCTT